MHNPYTNIFEILDICKDDKNLVNSLEPFLTSSFSQSQHTNSINHKLVFSVFAQMPYLFEYHSNRDVETEVIQCVIL